MTTATVTSTGLQALAPPGQPDISYHPDHEKWQARIARRQREGNLPTSIPKGFPGKLTGDLVWDGETIADNYDWTFVFSTEHLAEIDRAVAHFKGLNKPLGAISQETFPLPTLHTQLRGLSAELHSGHGFFVLRGLDVDKYTREENVIIYAGVSSHVASVRGRQDHQFNGEKADVTLTHIKDLTWSHDSKLIGSPAYTTDKQVFHTDRGDIVSLFALETSASGGASKLASTWRVYNEIAATRPDLIHTLSENWQMEIFEKADAPFVERPLIFHFPATKSTPERLALEYARRYFVGFGALPRNPAIPPITEAQAEALDTLHYLGERFCVNTDFQKGDIQYINNLAIFHARDGFTDTPDKRRHLLRLWLRDAENAWETPRALQPQWDRLYKGITVENEVLPLEPYIRSSAGHRPR
ncbi:TfdA family taurine catabolism dioxygenase TauD [Xylaria bambusicola]|uniref:TfdA family taurine catabolism dioxygenase TauD n=1 Tax=Xylaria bambusicola TaxID=326684 RepID=UPI00200770CC|nr:TfdA family taurine catabolism dioxygenase TauD [Xylaria bambusicola]KAI0526396.1 TfdA family taurine catabolism dioxygenase TauD [Xylaria bambusicola]